MISKRLAAKVPEETEGEHLCFVANVDDQLHAAAWEYILGKLIKLALPHVLFEAGLLGVPVGDQY